MKVLDTDNWERNIEMARSLLKDRKRSHMEIARLALEVCEITWGGGNKEGHKTLRSFAKEIGINEKTLSQWVAIRRNIFEKLPDELKVKARMMDLYLAARTVGSNCKPEEAIKAVSSVVYSAGPDIKIMRYLESLNTISHHMANEATVMQCKQELLEQILYVCSYIINRIKENGPQNLKPRNHDLRVSRAGTMKAAASLGVSRVWKMKDHDFAVLNYLKSQNDFVPLFKIYSSALPKIQKNTAKLRALRSLNKLSSMGYVLRDTNGYYRIKNIRTL